MSFHIRCGKIRAGGADIFYREAGREDAPVIVLFHGFPTASYMFSDLMPILAEKYHVIAPDYPGFGESEMVPRDKFAYTFDHLASVMDDFLTRMHVKKFAMYIFDYGAPIGMRIACKHPDRITAIISQNGNVSARNGKPALPTGPIRRKSSANPSSPPSAHRLSPRSTWAARQKAASFRTITRLTFTT